MSIMASVYQRDVKRAYLDDDDELPLPKRMRHCRQQWPLRCPNRMKKGFEDSEEFHCQVYLRLYAKTCKCTLEVIVKSTNEIIDEDDGQSILLARTRIAKVIQAGVIRVRLVSSLFAADSDVDEDPSLIKRETISSSSHHNSFDKQFALKLKNDRIGPGVIGKLFLEPLDPSNGSYTNGPPIFELNLSLASEHLIVSTALHQVDIRRVSNEVKISNCDQVRQCGCRFAPDESRLVISDQCNLKFNDMKLLHRLADPLRCQWRLIGRELAPCFSDMDLLDIQQTYFTTDGNHECTYQLLREWYTRDPHQANIRYLITRLKLPLELIVQIHDEIVRPLVSN